MKKVGRILILCMVAGSLAIFGCGAKKSEENNVNTNKACLHAVNIVKKDPRTKRALASIPRENRAKLKKSIQQQFENSCRSACRRDPTKIDCVQKAKKIEDLEGCNLK